MDEGSYDPYEDTLIRFTNGESTDDFPLVFFKPHGPVPDSMEVDLEAPNGTRRAKIVSQSVEDGKRVIYMAWISEVQPTP